MACMPTVRKGSSPLARGPPAELDDICRLTGLIPARAGTTGRRPATSGPHRAHPRSRGDHDPPPYQPLVRVGLIPARAGTTAVWRMPGSSWCGSSPLARGPLIEQRLRQRPQGLIPARAGTTAYRSPSAARTRAHPRSRGDHGGDVPPAWGCRGSSPLARGPPRRW